MALASLVAWVLLFKGIFDIAVAIVTHETVRLWWLGLIIGIVEILLAFWAAGYFRGSALLLVVWVAALRSRAGRHGDRDGVQAPRLQEDGPRRNGIEALGTGRRPPVGARGG